MLAFIAAPAQISVSLPHDIGLAVNRPDHGWWGAQLVEPYVTERVTWAIRSWKLSHGISNSPPKDWATTTARRRTCGARLLLRVSCFNEQIF